MGEARRRGTKAERRAAAIERNKKICKFYNLDPDSLTPSQIGRMNANVRHMTPEQRREILGED